MNELILMSFTNCSVVSMFGWARWSTLCKPCSVFSCLLWSRYFVQCRMMCAIVSAEVQDSQKGASSDLSRCLWVRYVCPILNRLMITSCLRGKFGRRLCCIVGSISCSLFLVDSHRCCHFARFMLLYCDTMSVWIWRCVTSGILIASLADMSAFSFPEIPVCEGIQSRVTDFPLSVSSVFMACIWLINGLLGYRLEMAVIEERESEQIIEF